MQIHVVAKQWMWKTQHPNGAREINALHVPIGSRSTLVMTSEDVIHSFFVPQFRIKQDVLPGRYTQTWFQATKPGTFHLFCTQLCGTEHARMVGDVVAMAPDDYARWSAAQPQADDIAKEGEKPVPLARLLGLPRARRSRSTRRPLAASTASPCISTDGRTVAADDAYIRDSILQPGRDIVDGYPNIMPSFAGPDRRRRDPRAHRLYPLAARPEGERPDEPGDRHRHRRFEPPELPSMRRPRSRSWLFTTDHKRIAHPLRDHHHHLLPHRRRRDQPGALRTADPERQFLSGRHLQQAVHAAWRDHGVVLPDPVDPQHARQFPAAADDRRAGRGLPASSTC